MTRAYAKPVMTQADNLAATLALVWGCTDKVARTLDADKLCDERGIRGSKRLDVVQAVNARKGRL